MDTYDPITLFTHREHAILAKYFGLQHLRPKEACDPSLFTMLAPTRWSESRKGVALKQGYECGRYKIDPETIEEDFIASGESSPSPVEAAVARICLDTAKRRESSSRRIPKIPGPPLESQFIATVDWGGEGFRACSWPEAYHITKIPYYNRWVVTSTRDTSEITGYDECAIFNSPSNQPERSVCCDALLRYWRYQLLFKQPVFNEIRASGLLAAADLSSVAALVWPSSEIPKDSWNEFVKRTGFDLKRYAEEKRKDEEL